MQEKVVQNVKNTKALVDALVKACDEQLDDEKSYILKLGFALQPQRVDDMHKIKTMLNKFRAAIAEFQEEMVIADLVLAINEDTSRFDTALVQRTHELLRAKVEVITDAEETTPESPEAA